MTVPILRVAVDNTRTRDQQRAHLQRCWAEGLALVKDSQVALTAASQAALAAAERLKWDLATLQALNEEAERLGVSWEPEA